MKPGNSSLNPYAASYIPLFRREVVEHTQSPGMVAKAPQSGNRNVWYGPGYAAENRQHGVASPITSASTESHYGHGVYGSSSQLHDGRTNKQIMDEESDFELEFLQMTFPGVSSESLMDVYAANNGDLENTVDMLNQLEVDIPLPDSLDIWDVSEPASPVKQKNAVGETSASSSGSSSVSGPVVSTT
ncbi:unnamed protein product [Linum tenue]|uniref:CUE domain-containing protein n=1 Tax=Linum tenue TaxID=586396 RepID=A0AAV0K4G5_9ROSI|nr:unnamed protein product [Linum tenue]